MTADDTALRAEIVRRIRALHTLKAGALRLFDPMLAAVGAARERPALSEVSDLLDRMHGVFGRHREDTADHAGRLAARLGELGAQRSRVRTGVVGVGAALRARVATAGGLNFGAAASEAFVFEHLEIAQAQLLEQLSLRAGDEETARRVREIRREDEDMAATIGRNWTNVLSLSLAAEGLPVLRPPEPAA